MKFKKTLAFFTIIFLSMFYVINIESIQPYRHQFACFTMAMFACMMFTFFAGMFFKTDDNWKEYNKLFNDPDFVRFVNDKFNRIDWTIENKARIVLHRFVDLRLGEYNKYREKRKVDRAAWLETDRTHEECSECDFVHVMPAVCSGHPDGPVACRERPKLMKEKKDVVQ